MNDQAYEAAQRLVAQEVVCCASSLIEDLWTLVNNAERSTINDLSLDEDELCQLITLPQDYAEPVEDHISRMDRDDVVELLTEASYECRDDEPIEVLREALFQHLKDEGDDALREFAEDNRIDPYERDIYEHWIVTGWLAHKLQERGEVAGELGNLWVWGRCTTGQSISLDGVIQEIATEFER